MFLKVSLSTLMSFTWFSFLTMVRESFPFLFDDCPPVDSPRFLFFLLLPFRASRIDGLISGFTVPFVRPHLVRLVSKILSSGTLCFASVRN